MKHTYCLIFAVLLSSCVLLNKDNTLNYEFKPWKNVPVFQNFISPWNEKPFGKTSFQYQSDTTWFYFLFNVIDDDIQLCDTSLNDELNVLQSDRVELFFTKDSLMQAYYTFEMDVANRLFDARCSILHNNTTTTKHSKHHKQINGDWDIDKNTLRFKSTQTKYGYRIEGKIRMSFLRNKQLITNNKLWCGIQRADFNAGKSTQWICAKDPKTKHPDFHCWGVFLVLSI